MPSILWIIPLIIFALLPFLVLRTLSYSRKPEGVPPADDSPVDISAAAGNLATVIRCPTFLKEEGAPPDGTAFAGLHAALGKMYPRIHAALEKEMLSDLSLLYTWNGRRPDLEAVLFAAHQDVVPVDPATLNAWTNPPFSGEIADGFVWGRGALDCKNQMVSILEAVNILLQQGFQPERTVYLAFGHDEETKGDGARKIVETLSSRGVRLAALVDEGGSVLEGVLPGIKIPVGLVGVTEKGYLTLELSVESPPGHSSMPPANTAIGILSKAITRVEASPLPGNISMIHSLFREVGYAAPFALRMVFANLWLFSPLIMRIYEKSAQTNAILRTTTAVTMVSGGVRDNILPRQATASVNFRLMPGDSQDAVVDHVRRVIADDRVRIDRKGGGGWDSSPISPTSALYYQQIGRAIRQVFGDVVVAPFLMLGATDARSYTSICDNIYRFMPCRLDKEDLGRMHGIDERISLENLEKMVRFFTILIKTWSV